MKCPSLQILLSLALVPVAVASLRERPPHMLSVRLVPDECPFPYSLNIARPGEPLARNLVPSEHQALPGGLETLINQYKEVAHILPSLISVTGPQKWETCQIAGFERRMGLLTGIFQEAFKQPESISALHASGGLPQISFKRMLYPVGLELANLLELSPMAEDDEDQVLIVPAPSLAEDCHPAAQLSYLRALGRFCALRLSIESFPRISGPSRGATFRSSAAWVSASLEPLCALGTFSQLLHVLDRRVVDAPNVVEALSLLSDEQLQELRAQALAIIDPSGSLFKPLLEAASLAATEGNVELYRAVARTPLTWELLVYDERTTLELFYEKFRLNHLNERVIKFGDLVDQCRVWAKLWALKLKLVLSGSKKREDLSTKKRLPSIGGDYSNPYCIGLNEDEFYKKIGSLWEFLDRAPTYSDLALDPSFGRIIDVVLSNLELAKSELCIVSDGVVEWVRQGRSGSIKRGVWQIFAARYNVCTRAVDLLEGFFRDVARKFGDSPDAGKLVLKFLRRGSLVNLLVTLEEIAKLLEGTDFAHMAMPRNWGESPLFSLISQQLCFRVKRARAEDAPVETI